MRMFIKETMTASGKTEEMTDEEFDKIFNQFDLDKSETIEKDEMAVLVKKLAGF